MSEVRPLVAGRVTREQAPGYILIAMPNPNRAGAFRTAITAPGCETVLVRDGEEARQEMARRGAPLLLIVDLSLPRVDGFEVVRELRRLATRTEAAVIAVSGHAPVRAAARRIADSLAIARVLPFDLERPALRDAVEAVLADVMPPRPAPAPRPAVKTTAAPGPSDPIEAAVLTAAARFRTAITVVYVKRGKQETVRGHFALSDLSGTVSTTHVLSFLREISGGSDPLIVPNVTHFPALSEIAPGGLTLVRGFAATPLATNTPQLAGAVCIMDTTPLEIDAGDLDALDAIARDLTRELGPEEPPPREEPETPSAATSPVDVDALERLASTDPLTGLANRRGGDDLIAIEISRARRHRTALSCVLLDLDHFKEINDNFGHQAGDYALREIGGLMRRTLRAYDIIIRWGGEEFLVVLPGVELDKARALAERLRGGIQGVSLSGIGGVTASFGVSELGGDYSFDTMFAAADRRLYAAKSRGRNNVE